MRALAVALLAFVAFAAAACEEEAPTRAPPAAATTTAPRPTARQIDDCRDQCEQSQIVAGQADDAALRACRARCAGGSGTASSGGPHEVPRSISRSPSLSGPPPVRPLRATPPRR